LYAHLEYNDTTHSKGHSKDNDGNANSIALMIATGTTLLGSAQWQQQSKMPTIRTTEDHATINNWCEGFIEYNYIIETNNDAFFKLLSLMCSLDAMVAAMRAINIDCHCCCVRRRKTSK
jgi:hypothetical protein